MSRRNSRDGKAQRRAERAAQQAHTAGQEPAPGPLADTARTLAGTERVALLAGRLRHLLGDHGPIADAYGRLDPAQQAEARGLMRELHDLGAGDYARLAALGAEAAGPGAHALDALPQMTPAQRHETAEIIARRGKAGSR